MQSIKAWLLNNLSLKVLSLATAIVLWYFLGQDRVQYQERSFVLPVQIKNSNKAERILLDPPKVTIRFRGRGGVLEGLTEEKISAYVNLRGVNQDTTVPISVSSPAAKKRCRRWPSSFRSSSSNRPPSASWTRSTPRWTI